MKKLLFLLTLLSACTVEPIQESTEDSEVPSESARLDVNRCYENNAPIVTVDNEDFRETDQGHYGQFTFEGTITSIIGEAPFSGETVENIYLKVDENDGAAFQYYQSLVEDGNTINFMQDDKLYFMLGLLETGKVVSSASMTDETEAKILAALESGEVISLTMLQAVEMGRGAGPGSTFACVIE